MALVVGLTGGIASGKSLVSSFLGELGAAIIDADELSRAAVAPQSPAWREIREVFGTDVFLADGSLNRKKMAAEVFASEAKREKLNRIVHPRVIEATLSLKKRYEDEKKAPLIVIDAPLLIEAGMHELVDEVWVVAVPEEVQIARLMERDGFSRQEAEERLAAQMPLSEKLRYADRIIDNSRDLAGTKEQLELIWGQVTGDR